MSTRLRKRNVSRASRGRTKRTVTKSTKRNGTSKTNPGRWYKLDRRLIERFCDLIRRGLPSDAACDYLGVTYQSFHHWVQTGKSLLDTPEDKIPEEKQICVEFVNAFRRAFAEYRMERIDLLHGRNPKDPKKPVKRSDWVREMTVLERRDRRNFSRLDPQGGGEEDYDPDESFL